MPGVFGLSLSLFQARGVLPFTTWPNWSWALIRPSLGCGGTTASGMHAACLSSAHIVQLTVHVMLRLTVRRVVLCWLL
jgi:hypothetical protein